MKIKLNEQGLLPAIAQDANTGQVLMMGYMNPRLAETHRGRDSGLVLQPQPGRPVA